MPKINPEHKSGSPTKVYFFPYCQNFSGFSPLCIPYACNSVIFSLHKTIKVTPLHKIKQNLNESDKRQDIVKAFCNK